MYDDMNQVKPVPLGFYPSGVTHGMPHVLASLGPDSRKKKMDGTLDALPLVVRQFTVAW
jgi:hypothetical protein